MVVPLGPSNGVIVGGGSDRAGDGVCHSSVSRLLHDDLLGALLLPGDKRPEVCRGVSGEYLVNVVAAAQSHIVFADNSRHAALKFFGGPLTGRTLLNIVYALLTRQSVNSGLLRSSESVDLGLHLLLVDFVVCLGLRRKFRAELPEALADLLQGAALRSAEHVCGCPEVLERLSDSAAANRADLLAGECWCRYTSHISKT